ncbi:MAG: hypothetical protein ABL998_16705 [Planctomycetota bacterium]
MNRHPSEPEREALDQRIDAALRRRFTPPASLDSLAARVRARGRRRRLEFLLLACAAVLVAARGLWWRARPAERRFERLRPDRLALDGAAFDAPAFCQLVGPLEEVHDPALPQAPDLVALYRAMDVCQRSSAAVACEENDELLARLQASYGPDIALRSEASGLLHGPFASAEWPTGTILTGTSEDLTTVLVAERDTTLDCCVRMRLAESSGLNVFTWNVGDLALTEISPHDEPRFLQLFE